MFNRKLVQSQEGTTGQTLSFKPSVVQQGQPHYVHLQTAVRFSSVLQWSDLCNRRSVHERLHPPLWLSSLQKRHIFLRLHPPPVRVVLQVHFAIHFASIQVDLSVFVRSELGALVGSQFLLEAVAGWASCLHGRFLQGAVSLDRLCLGVALRNWASFTRLRGLGPDRSVLFRALRLGLGRADRNSWFPSPSRSNAISSDCAGNYSPWSTFHLNPIFNPCSIFTGPNPTNRPHPCPSCCDRGPGASPCPAPGSSLWDQWRGGTDDWLRAGGTVLIHVIRQRVQVAADGDVVQLVVRVLQAAPGASPRGVGALAQAVLAAGEAAAAARQCAALLHQPFYRLDAFMDGQQLLQDLHVHRA